MKSEQACERHRRPGKHKLGLMLQLERDGVCRVALCRSQVRAAGMTSVKRSPMWDDGSLAPRAAIVK